MNDDYMDRVIDLNSGHISSIDPYYYAGVGKPDGLVSLDALTDEQARDSLPQIIAAMDRRIRALERADD